MILEAARQLFKEKGFEASTVDEIATLAELVDVLYQLYDIFIQYHRERSEFAEALFVQVNSYFTSFLA